MLISNAMPSIPVLVDAPLVRTCVRAHLAGVRGPCVHAFVLPMPPERPPHFVAPATDYARVHVSVTLLGVRVIVGSFEGPRG